MYCSIQEAWGNNDSPSKSNLNNQELTSIVNQNTILNSNISPLGSAVENFTDKDIEEFLNWKNNTSNTQEILSKECLSIINHFKSCDKCKKYYYKINGNLFDLNTILSKIGISLIDTNNKEILLIFLIGIVLILIFHLFNK